MIALVVVAVGSVIAVWSFTSIARSAEQFGPSTRIRRGAR